VKIYLAARYGRRDQMRELAVELRRLGHTVTTHWLETEWANRPDQSSAAPPEYREKYALINAEDVKDADCVINFTEAPGDGSRGGRHVEFGMAYAWGKRLIVVGFYENLFHHLPGVEFFATAEDMVRSLDVNGDTLGEPA
jgi:hypothetical protein